MKSKYDVVVVGGGPAGSCAARSAAEKGASVLMLEKDREIGLPVRCAEGITAADLAEFVEVKPAWIAATVHRARFFAPDGTTVDSSPPGDMGYVLHRKLFDADLAGMAAEAGAEVLTKACVSGLIIEDGFVRGVRVEHLGRETAVSAAVVIGADGVESSVGRRAGLDTRTPPEDIASCAQMTLGGIQIDGDTAEFHLGETVAPGGYAWVFPKGRTSANIGLGIPIRGCRMRKPIEWLKAFVERRFPNASVLTLVAGGVPLCPPPGDIVTDGLMLAGDAAHQADPISGGGILYAMRGGGMAGDIAALAARSGDASKKALLAYAKAWRNSTGKSLEQRYRFKQVLMSLGDDDLNKIARTLLKIPPEERTAYQIFKAGLTKHPKLLIELAKHLF
jgi:digeranylgeranylglycerophospholipid reductase